MSLATKVRFPFRFRAKKWASGDRLARLGYSFMLACVCSVLVGIIAAARPAPTMPPETGGCINEAMGNMLVGPIAALITLPIAIPLLFAGLTLRARRCTPTTQILSQGFLQSPEAYTAARGIGTAFLSGFLLTIVTPFLPAFLNPLGLLSHFMNFDWFFILLTTSPHFPKNSLLGLFVIIGLFTLVFTLISAPFVFVGVFRRISRTATVQEATTP